MSKRILILAGDSIDLQSLVVTLETGGYEVVRRRESQTLLNALSDSGDALCIMLQLPSPWTALSMLCRQLRRVPGGERAPIMLLGSREDIPVKDGRIIAAGVWPKDIYPIPYDGSLILRRLREIPAGGEEPPGKADPSDAHAGAMPTSETPPPPQAVLVEKAPKAPKARAEQRDRGTLNRVTPARLILARHREGETGSLALIFPEGRVVLYLDKGKLVGFEGSGGRGLGAWLVSSNRLKAGDLPSEDPTLGELIGGGQLSPHEAFETLKAFARETLKVKASARQGAFEWEADATPPGGAAIPIDLNLHRVLLDGLIEFPPVGHPLPKKLAQAVPHLTPQGERLLPTLKLTALESRLLRLVDGRLRLFNVVAQAAGDDDGRLRQMEATLIGLRDIGCLKLSSRASRRGAQSQADVMAAAQGRHREGSETGDGTGANEDAKGEEKGQNKSTSKASEALLKEAERIADADPFDTLGVSPKASIPEVREVFRELSKRFHPDRFFDASPEDQRLARDIYQEMKDAFSILSDEAQRTSFTKMREAGAERPITQEDEFRGAVAFNKGELFLKNRSWEKAKESFDLAVELDPLKPAYAIHADWAAFRCDSESAKKLIPHLHALLKKDKQSGLGFYYLGVMFKAYGDMNQAKAAFKRAVSLDPRLLEPKRELRLIEMRKQKASEESGEKEGGKGFFGFMKR